MIKAVIIEDTKGSLDHLKNLLKKYENINVIEKHAERVGEGIKLIEKEKPDVVFLDIQLKGKSGYDILNEVLYRDFYVIVTTGEGNPNDAHGEYDGIPIIGFLEKPILEEEGHLDKAIKRLMETIQKEIVTILHSKGAERVKISNIMLCRKAINTSFFTQDSAEFIYKKKDNYHSIVSTESLKYFKEKHKHIFDTFFNAGEKCFLNKTYIDSYDENTVTMSNKEKIYLTEDKFREFRIYIL